MAGGPRILRSTTHGAGEPPSREATGHEPETRRDDVDREEAPPTDASGHSSHTLEENRTMSTTLPLHQRRPDNEEPAATDLQTVVTQLLLALNAAELSGAPEEEIDRRQRQFDRAVETLQRTQSGRAPGSSRPAFDEASRIIRVLNNLKPQPKLGSESRPPTTQQVDQWIKDIEGAFQYAQVLEDSVTRTHWIMGTIQFNTHRELIQQRINEGSIRTWADLRAEEEQLVQDPVFTRYENYQKFFNFEWRPEDTVNSFLMKLNRRESLLPRSFSKFDDGTEDHEFRIAFVWSRIPSQLQREIQRNGALEHLKEWAEFERALRNAETAIGPLSQQQKGEHHFKGKRGPTSPPRIKFKRQNSRGSTPARSDPGKTPGDNRPPPSAPVQHNRWTPQDRGNQTPREGTHKPHWRNRDFRGNEGQQKHKQGNGKP